MTNFPITTDEVGRLLTEPLVDYYGLLIPPWRKRWIDQCLRTSAADEPFPAPASADARRQAGA